MFQAPTFHDKESTAHQVAAFGPCVAGVSCVGQSHIPMPFAAGARTHHAMTAPAARGSTLHS